MCLCIVPKVFTKKKLLFLNTQSRLKEREKLPPPPSIINVCKIAPLAFSGSNLKLIIVAATKSNNKDTPLMLAAEYPA
jgi:hypothetical protein